MASLLVRTLLVLVCAFAALSASAAAALGLAEERILAFTALVSVLLLLPFLYRPRLSRPSGPELVLAALATGIVLSDLAGSFAILDAKLALPVLALLAAPNLARYLPPEELTRFVWRLLSAYVVATFLYQLFAEPAAVARGYENIVRYDPTGSVVMHSSLSLIHLIVALARLGRRLTLPARAGDPGPGVDVPGHGVPDRDPHRPAHAGAVRPPAGLECGPPRPRPAPPRGGRPRPRPGVPRLDPPGERQLLAASRRRPGRFQLRPPGVASHSG